MVLNAGRVATSRSCGLIAVQLDTITHDPYFSTKRLGNPLIGSAGRPARPVARLKGLIWCVVPAGYSFLGNDRLVGLPFQFLLIKKIDRRFVRCRGTIPGQ